MRAGREAIIHLLCTRIMVIFIVVIIIIIVVIIIIVFYFPGHKSCAQGRRRGGLGTTSDNIRRSRARRPFSCARKSFLMGDGRKSPPPAPVFVYIRTHLLYIRRCVLLALYVLGRQINIKPYVIVSACVCAYAIHARVAVVTNRSLVFLFFVSFFLLFTAPH